MKLQSMTLHKIIICGGGTGGHIYPALTIADQIKKTFPSSEILFVGANGKMEMEKVPSNGYKIKGLNIAGFNRSSLFKNITLPFKLLSSLIKAYKIVSDFKPTHVIGTGGYVSGPVLLIAMLKNIPYFIQEQNSLPGITNKFLAQKAKYIFVAYKGLHKYFPNNKIKLTGNPIRANIFMNLPNSQEAKEKFGLNKDKFTILSLGGSQGARSINEAWLNNLEEFKNTNYQLIWQTGKPDFQKITNQCQNSPIIKTLDFITNMQDAYAASDLIISRAGAIAISELMLVGKPCVFIPLPTAAADHQTVNCLSLIKENAAIMVKNSEIKLELLHTIKKIEGNKLLQNSLAENIKKLAEPNAAEKIIKLIFKE
ncbi:MAG: undecaprenyldiphospho-muramoylpentapeptide beta-N-acetylglucosaminyltransferase [Solirubrobacteraceae bacterium]